MIGSFYRRVEENFLTAPNALRKFSSTRLLSKVRSTSGQAESPRKHVGEFSSSIDLGPSTVQDPPNYIFLCGGRLTDLGHSLRAQFYEQKVRPDPALLERVKLAEVADEWYRTRKLFSDLLGVCRG